LKKIVNFKFDHLTKKTLNLIKDCGCRVLHLSSDEYRNKYLCVEGENGEIEYLSHDELKHILTPNEGDKLNVDVVVIAVPESYELGELFVEMGVKHVVCFDFK